MKAAEKAAAKQLGKRGAVKKLSSKAEAPKKLLPDGPVKKIAKPKVDRKQRLQVSRDDFASFQPRNNCRIARYELF